MMARRSRRVVLAVHLFVSVGWLGALVAYLVLAMAAQASSDGATIRGAWIAMELVGWYAITPLAVASLGSGIILAFGPPWRLFDHYWIVISLALTAAAVAVLVVHMPDVSATVDSARAMSGAQLEQLDGDVAHPALGLVVLVVIQILNMYKPRGLTRRGHRRRLRSIQAT